MVYSDFSVVGFSFARKHFGWLSNPGALYNSGNAVALIAGLVQCALQANLDASSSALELQRYFFGTWPALFTSTAVLLFFWGGQKYSNAWAKGFPPIERDNLMGHQISAIGAVLIGFGLMGFSKDSTTFALAVITTLLHAAGKFGSWMSNDKISAFKIFPLFSRFTYAASISLGIFVQNGSANNSFAELFMPCALLLATILWARADWLLRPRKSV
jgi:hypothetical protein